MKNLKNFIAVSFLAFLVACNSKFELAKFDSDYLVPIAFGTIDLGDYDRNDQIQISGTDTIQIEAAETILNLGLEDLVGIPDTTVNQEFVIPFGGISFPPGVPFFSDTTKTVYRLKEVKLKYAIIKEAEIEVKLSNTIDKPVIFTYQVLSATKDGQIFKVEELIPGNSNRKFTYSLAGYKLDLRGVDGNLTNTITSLSSVMIDSNETQNHTFLLGDKFTISNTFRDFVPEFVTGFFGSQGTNFQDSSALELFQNYPFDFLDINRFKLSLTVDNGIGADLQLKTNQIGSYNFATNSPLLTHSIIENALSLNRAARLGEFDVKHQRLEVLFTNANSNLDELIEISPEGLFYNMNILTNPLGNISLGNDFAFYDHNLSAAFKLEFPLSFALGRLHIRDTSDYSFSLAEDSALLDQLNFGKLKVRFTNGYPLEADIQVYVINAEKAIIDSLFDTRQTIEGASEIYLNNAYESTISDIESFFDRPKLERLEEGEFLLLDAFLSTTNRQIISLNASSKIDFKIVAELNATLQ